MPVFPKNNLPIDSLNWGREVEKSINNLETTLRSAEVNNVTRDAQLQNSYKRLDATVTQVSSVANQAQTAATDAAAAAAAAQNAVDAVEAVVNNIYVDGTEEIDGSVLATNTINGAKVVDGTLPGGKIQANTITANQISTNYVYAGQINAGQINAGTVNGLSITGGSLNTTPAGGKSVSIASSSATFQFNGSTVGLIEADSAGRILVQGNSGVYLNGGAGVFGGGLSVGDGSISTQGLTATGTVSASVITGTSSVSGVSVTGGSVTSSGSLVRTQLNGDGFGLTGASVTSGGAFVRTSSSARYKQDIEDLDISYEAILGLQPKTFRRIDEVEEQGDSAKVYAGFIAEDIADSELDIFAFYKLNEDGSKTPEGVHYPELTAALVLALKHQDQVIKNLTARIEALEA